MAKLNLSVAIGDYDRNRAIIDGRVQIDGVDPTIMTLVPEEIFFRAFRQAQFDVCELSLSSFTVKVSQGDCPYVAIPAFLSRAFRHTSVYIRNDRGITKPEDLKGKRIGTPEFQLTACVWARAILEEDYGVTGADINWVRGGIEQPGRAEKISLQLPPEIKIESAPADKSLNQMLVDGELDGFIGPRAPSSFERGHPNVVRLWPDPIAIGSDFWRRTHVFPIMHVLGLRKTIAEQHPWLPAALLKAFNESKAAAMEHLIDTSATKVTLPFVEEQLDAARALMGDDFWPYGVEKSRPTLEYFFRHHHHQGLSSRLMTPEEIFHPGTLETYRI